MGRKGTTPFQEFSRPAQGLLGRERFLRDGLNTLRPVRERSTQSIPRSCLTGAAQPVAVTLISNHADSVAAMDRRASPPALPDGVEDVGKRAHSDG